MARSLQSPKTHGSPDTTPSFCTARGPMNPVHKVTSIKKNQFKISLNLLLLSFLQELSKSQGERGKKMQSSEGRVICIHPQWRNGLLFPSAPSCLTCYISDHFRCLEAVSAMGVNSALGCSSWCVIHSAFSHFNSRSLLRSSPLYRAWEFLATLITLPWGTSDSTKLSSSLSA